MPGRGRGTPAPEAVAILGMAGRFPGCQDIASFGELIARGGDAVREIPPRRWHLEGFYDPGRNVPNRSVSRWLGVLDGVDRFDHRFFNISARDAASMDPQQRLLLETVWHAIEDAGLSPEMLRTGRTAVFAGVMATDYHQLLAQPGVEVEAAAGLGAYGGILANRISHALGLTEQSVTVDAACASSLVALHQARRALLDGACDHAIVAAASLNLDPWKYRSFSKAGMLSPTGRCRTFDASADGYVPGDGVAAIVLARAHEASAPRALVRGTAVNHCGETASITHPSADAQERVIRAALDDAGLSPDDISYVECHGTGTALGDPVEVEALNRVFAARPRDEPCWIGSVKANIGHLEAAAGLAGLIKCVVMLEAGRLVSAAHLEIPNPLCRFSETGIQPVRTTRDWEKRNAPRRAGVSSFGMGGVNAHAVIEEVPEATAQTVSTKGPFPILLSAADRDGLAALIERWRGFAATDQFRSMPLHDIAATLATGRAALRHRIGIWVDSHDAVIEWLNKVSADDARPASTPFLLAFAAPDTADDPVPLMQSVLGKPGLLRRRAEARPQAFLAALKCLGAAPLAVSGIGIGLDRALMTALPLIDPDATALYRLPQPDAAYLRGLLDAARFDTETANRMRDLARTRRTIQPSFTRQIEVWRPALAPHGLDPETVFDADAAGAQILAAIIAITALREVAGRWNLKGQTRETGPLAELAELVQAHILPHATLVDALLREGDIGVLPVSLEQHALLAGRPDDFPRLAARDKRQPDAATLDAWYRRDTPPAAAFHTVRRLDSATLARLTLDLWLSGHRIDWTQVFPKGVCHRTPLPLYPFQGQSFPASRADFGQGEPISVPASARTKPAPADPLREQLRERVALLASEAPERIGDDDSFFDLGLNSIQLQELTTELGERFSGVTPTLLFQHTTLKQLADHLTTLPDKGGPVPVLLPATAQPEVTANEPIAIIGMSGRFPEAPDIWALWQNLMSGHDAIRPVPPERWNGPGFSGGFIENVARFEPLFFNISAREAERMDPQQRLALENVWTTLEHAGYGRREAYAGSRTGVFLGSMWNEYSLHADAHARATGEWGGPGTLAWAMANRVSYALDLRGPSMAVDTACSSSLSAVHLAAQALRNGDCDMAVAGGVNLSIHPAKYRYLSEAKFLSSDGRCRSFGEGGDGYVPGEGVASVLLKPLSKALADGDRIYGVLLGSSVNHGGRAAGFTVPSPRAQQELAETALARAGIAAGDVDYIECHGTGTTLGDPIEIEALTAAYAGAARGSIAIGSIKSNIGHLEAAAGVAGLIKILLAFEHDHLPPSLHSEPGNSRIDFASTPFTVLRQGRAWARKAGRTRHAALSSFGAGGANAHAVLAAPESVQVITAQPGPASIRLTARSATALVALCRRMAECITETPAPDLSPVRIAATMTRRQMFDVGIEITAENLAHLGDKLRDTAMRLERGETPAALPAINSNSEKLPPCSLPGTHFEGEDYWIGGAHALSTHSGSQPTAGPRYDSINFAPDHPLVTGHIIGGEPVLAGAVALEAVRRAVAASGHFSDGFALTGLSWAKALKGGKAAAITLMPEGNTLRVAVEQDGATALRAMAEPATELDIRVAPQPQGESLDIAALYEDFAAAGYNYGPAFRTLKTVRLGRDTAFADLAADDAESILAPGLIDGALQLCLAVLRRRGGAAAVPVGMDRVRWSGPLPRQLTIEARLKEGPARGLWRAEITGFSEDRPCLQLDGVTLRETDLSRMGKPAPATRFTRLVWRADEGKPRTRPPLAVVDMTPEARPLADALTSPLVSPDDLHGHPDGTLVIPLPDDDVAMREAIWPVAKLLRNMGPEAGTVILTHRTHGEPRPDAAALSGLLRVLRIEMPKLDARSVEVPGDMRQWTAALTAEAALDRPADPELCWREGRRHVRTEEDIPVPATRAPLSAGPWLITGGFGGLGLLMAERLVTRGVTALALIGRTAEPKSLQDRVRLEALKARATILGLAADVCDAGACTQAVGRAIAELGPLAGAVHAAGILRDGLLRFKRAEDFAAVLAPKIAGAENLAAALKDQPPHRLVLFSSLTAARGNLGQADYAYANRWLDLFAETHANAVAIGWPLWREGGMTVPEEQHAALSQMLGSGILETAAGLDAFETALGLGQPHVTVSVPLAVRAEKPAPAGRAVTDVPEALRLHLLALLSRITKIPEQQLDPAKPVDAYGVDSVMALEFVTALEADAGPLSKVLLYEHPTLDAVAAYLASEHPNLIAKFAPQTPETIPQTPAAARTSEVFETRMEARPATREPIAIIGLAGRFPGADDLDAFWQNLRAGRDCIRDIPQGRWRDADWPKGFHGGLLEGVDLFDPLVFGISPKDARLMDPQARLFLETALHALEDGGYAGAVEGAPVGVFAAAMWGQYELLGAAADGPVPGSSFAEIANRVSHAFGLTGPSLAVDSMCSSSLAALHLACESLRRGECEMALAGGVNLSLRPEKYRQLQQGGFLSSDGRCRSFGGGGDGYVPGEGVAVALLKPLSRALADGDAIWGVIQGSALNHGGRAKGYTVPNPNAQGAVIAAALREAGVTPDDIGYIEAHGTGTALGDPIEIAGLMQVFARESGPWPIGSVKSQIGHLEAAAGMAGLAKVLLQMRAGEIAPGLHIAERNSAIDWERAPFLLHDRVTPWPDARPRRAVVSSFGAGGSNGHIVVEQVPVPAAAPAAAAGPQVIPISARTPASLEALCDRLLVWLDKEIAASGESDCQSLRHALADALGVSPDTLNDIDALADLGLDATSLASLAAHAGKPVSTLAGIETVGQLFTALGGEGPGPNLADIAFTLQTGRLAMTERLCLVANNLRELRDGLSAWRAGARPAIPVSRGQAELGETARAATERARAALAGVNLAALAGAFAQGAEVEWRALHPAPRRRIRLPLYAFERKRYWFEPEQTQAPAPPTTPKPAPAIDDSAAMRRWQVRAKDYTGDAVRVAREGGIAMLTLNRPQDRNMLGEELALGLARALDQLAQDAAARCVVIAAEGETFSMGGTPEMLRAIAAGEASFTDVPVFYRALVECPLPVVTAMAGHAYGGGLLFGLYGDMPVLAEESLYAAIFADYGFTPGMGATLLLPHRLGPLLAGEMMMTARAFTGAELGARGAPVKVVPRVRVLDEAMAIARSLARKPRTTLELMKRDLARPLIEGLGEAIARERAMHAESFHLPEVRAHLERRFGEDRPETAAARATAREVRVIAASAADIAATVRQALAAVLMMEPGEVMPGRSFQEQGLDSIGAVEFVAALNRELGAALEVTELYDHPTVDALAAHMVGVTADRSPGEEGHQDRPEPHTAPDPALPERHGSSGTALSAPPQDEEKESAASTIITPVPHTGKGFRESRLVPVVTSEPAPGKIRLRPLESTSHHHDEETRQARPEPRTSPAVAIIGMAARFPGADDIGAFWYNLMTGTDSVTDVPYERWDAISHYSPDPTADGKTVSRWGGFLSDIAGFDAEFFGFSPMEAAIMEPQQRLVLEECWRALEDAAIAPGSLKGAPCGVFLGAAVGDYEERLAQAGAERSAQAFTGLAPSVHAARIAYALDLTGPALAIDTACSSSLVAVHQARRALIDGDCNLALAGGVMVMTTPRLHIRASQSGMLSPTGRCRPFSADADGIALAEGVGIVVLKRLEDALRDGDPIRAVIRGSGVGQDGRTNGITAPSARSQEALIRRVQAEAGIAPDSIGYVEAHGTGTALGDPIELRALTTAFGGSTSECLLGSVKANIGHATTAAGVAGLIKAALAVERGEVPPQIHLGKVNERITLDKGPFRIPRTAAPWNGAPRRAAVSSFGFSGTNAHVILEQAPEAPRIAASAHGPLAFILSARTTTALRARRTALANWLRGEGQAARLADIAHTLATGRDRMDHRFTALADSRDVLIAALETGADAGLDDAALDAAATLHGARRIHLPPYDFDHVRHWIEGSRDEGMQAGITFALDIANPLLADHRRDAAPILPGAAYLTLALEATGAHALADVRWHIPYGPGAHGQLPPLRLEADGQALRFTSALLAPGEAHATAERTAVPRAPGGIDIAARRARGTRLVNAQTFYAAFARKGLNLGPAFSRLLSLVAGKGWVLSDLAAGNGPEAGLLDSALQGVLALIDSTLDSPRLHLPVGLDRFSLYGDLTDARHALIEDRGEAEGERIFDVTLLDGAGNAVAEAQGFRLRAVEPRAAKPVLRLVPQWRDIAAPQPVATLHHAGESLPAHATHILARMDAETPENLFSTALELVRVLAIPAQRRHVTLAVTNAPAARALTGFARSLARENPHLDLRIAQVTDGGETMLEALAASNVPGNGALYRIGADRIETLEFREDTAHPAAQSLEGVWLVTGGFGKLGCVLAAHLARQGARPVLVGRRAPDEATRRAIAAMPGNPVTVVADLGDPTAAARAVTEARRAGPLQGVLHCAGTSRDGLLAGKTDAGWRAVLTAKIATIENVWRAAKEDNPQVIAFTSVAALRGQLGQTDYAFANGWLDGLAEQQGGAWRSMAWSWWREGGMALGEDALEQGARDGIAPIETREGLAAFDAARAAGPNTLLVAGDAARILAVLNRSGETLQGRAAPGADVTDSLMAELAGMVQNLLKLAPEAIAPEKTFESYGFDSITLTRLAARMAKRFECDITPAIFFEENTLSGLARLLLARFPAIATALERLESPTTSVPALPRRNASEAVLPAPQTIHSLHAQPRHAPIAVIGMAGRFPGSPDLDSLWRNLAARKNLVTEIPPARWDWREFDGMATPGSGCTNSRWGGFIDGVDLFDARFFGISPREAELMDPQQRVFLETVWHAIEDAGLDPGDLADTATGLFTGVSTADYLDLLLRAGAPIEAHTATGLSHAMLPNRISYLLDLHGPSEPVDTACSSSLIAVARAVDALRRGDCDMAIAGGVNLILSPTLHLAFGQAGMLSPTGACRSFDAAADGYVRGEGAGAVLLKPLDRALADGDPIHGVIRGITVNHGGRAASLTAPNPKAQAALIRAAIEQAGIAPESIGYIETHGTGTPLGDPVEITALMQVMGEGARREPCRLGAVKANIGHLEAAAGIAGLIKVLLGFRHGAVPGHPHFRELNPHIRLDPKHLAVAEETTPWPHVTDAAGRELPRRAGLSSFGFGGAYAHAILEEFSGSPGHAPRPRRAPTVFKRQRFWAEDARPVRGVAAVERARPAAANGLAGLLHAPAWCRIMPDMDVGPRGPALVIDAGGNDALAEAVIAACGGERIAVDDIASALTRQPGHIVWLDADTTPDPRDPAGQAARQERSIIPLFRLVRMLGERGPDGLRLTVITRGATDHANTPARPSAAAAIGLALCLAQEQSGWNVHLCDLGPGGEARILEALRLASTAPVVLGLDAEGFSRRTLRPASLAEASAEFGTHVLILGGAGGIGAAMAERFAGAGVRHITLMGRRAEDEAIRALKARLESLGASARYMTANASDANELAAALESIRQAPDTVINAVMTLHPARLARMEEDDFRAAFAAKAGVAVALDAALAQAGMRPRHVLHMSSVQSLIGSVGQGNYAAGCSFLDAWATGSGAKCVSWGWWGSVGAVVGERYRTEMEAAGSHSIEPDEGFAAIEQLLAGDVRHLVAAKGTPEALKRLGLVEAEASDSLATALDALEAAIPALVAARLGNTVPAVPDSQRRLHNAVLAIAAEARDNSPDLAGLRARHPSIAAHLDLLEAALAGLPDVLAGRVDGASVLLPGGSPRLVEPVYAGNTIVDAANAALAETVRAAVASGAHRIIEIGAGTGGATGAALSGIKAAGREVRYTYTDLSRAFLHHGERSFAPRLPGMEFRLLDIARDPQGQGFEAGGFDMAIAANVLHATPDIVTTLKHARALLAPGGRLALIELTKVLRFNTVTFGLLPGWWNATDPERRLPASPLLDASGWRAALEEAGFIGVTVTDYGAAVSLVTARVSEAAAVPASPDTHHAVIAVLADVLRMPEGEIEPAATFTDLGVDSILAGEVAQKLSAATGLELKPTELFNHPSPERLARHIAARAPVAAPAAAPSRSTDDALADLLDRFERDASERRRAAP